MYWQALLDRETPEEEECYPNIGHVDAKVLNVAQDMVYDVSCGKKWTPKHIGLASTLHQATRSKDLLRLFNKAGHCLSYEQVLQLDTALAEKTLESLDHMTGAVIPENLVPRKFIHFTADNIDILDETLDGKNTFHATQVAAWQRGPAHNVNLDNVNPPTTHTTLLVPRVMEELCPVTVKTSTDHSIFQRPVDSAWFQMDETKSARIKKPRHQI